MKRASPLMCCACLIALSALQTSAAERKPVPIPSAPVEKTFTSLRDARFCELWFFVGTPETGFSVVYYNSMGLNNAPNKNDFCPADIWDKVGTKQLESEYDVSTVQKNMPHGPRGWLTDAATLPVGSVETFEGWQARWMGQVPLPKGATAKFDPYNPVQSHRKSTYTFEKGKPVFILQDAEGTPWVMQSFDPALTTYNGLKDLAGKLKLPAGWKYRVVVLDKDLTMSTPGGYNWIVFDDLSSTYNACKDSACNYQP